MDPPNVLVNPGPTCKLLAKNHLIMPIVSQQSWIVNHPTSNLVEDILYVDLELAWCLTPFPMQPRGRIVEKWHNLTHPTPQNRSSLRSLDK